MIRVTLVRGTWTSWNGQPQAPKTIVREFDDEAHAQDWFINDSYFAEGYTRSATWERIDV